MKLRLLPALLGLLLLMFSCHDNSTANHTDSGSSTYAGIKLPPDALALTKPLIKGRLYKEASLEQGTVLNFDTSQFIIVLDTTDALFVRARLEVDSASYTGFVLKAILPE